MTGRRCAECGTTEPGRNGWTRMLCTPCYKRNHHAGTLDRYPTADRGAPATACLRCGVPTRYETRECQDCRNIESRIEAIDPLEGQWVRHNLVHRFHAA